MAHTHKISHQGKTFRWGLERPCPQPLGCQSLRPTLGRPCGFQLEHLERDAASSALHAHCELTDTTPRDCILGLSAAPPGLSTPEPGAAGPPKAVLPQVGTGSTIKGRVGRDSAISALLCPQAQAGSCSGVPAGCSGPLPRQPVPGYEMLAEF